MLTTINNAPKGNDVAVMDIPGAYLSAGRDDEMHSVFRDTLTGLIVAVGATLYRPFVSYTMGQAVLYARPRKALYGYIKSVFLFYEKLVGAFEAYWFKINPYDLCVASKMVGRIKLTV